MAQTSSSPKLKKPKLTDAERHERFVEIAKKVEASDRLEDFDKAFDSLNIKDPARTTKGSRN